MVRKVPAGKWSVDQDHYEIVNKRTMKRECIGDVWPEKRVAVLECARINREYHNGERQRL